MGIGVPRAGTPGGPGALAGGRARGPLCPARADGDLSAPLKPYQQDWRHSPRSQTPLKPHIALRGEDRTTTCAFLGNPRPAATVYKGGVNITANSKFWYKSTSRVCTIFIRTCTLQEGGE